MLLLLTNSYSVATGSRVGAMPPCIFMLLLCYFQLFHLQNFAEWNFCRHSFRSLVETIERYDLYELCGILVCNA